LYSSLEVKYQALSSTTLKIQMLTYLLCDLHIIENSKASLYCDNKPIRHIVLNPSFYKHTKHINTNNHVVQEKLHINLFCLLLININEKLSHIFTKPLDRGRFNINI